MSSLYEKDQIELNIALSLQTTIASLDGEFIEVEMMKSTNQTLFIFVKLQQILGFNLQNWLHLESTKIKIFSKSFNFLAFLPWEVRSDV